MASSANYQVVARRYRPASFSDLVGQSQVAVALGNAIEQNRVGHAYLFTGARGVGKTSSARIFAKCLNCSRGPTTTPCNECDICQGVSAGDDVDVLEIDGASNRGIDEIRQLRANANIRPSRARYKIYIIDEVHMLTPQAFNALLKTLEEPPAHVKFVFCTTDPDKIPITVLSRCQRFDFPPIRTAAIRDRLRQIVDQENIAADDAALELLARRAGGSMRDSQSLLEQLLSYATDRITVDDVHSLLGTADNALVLALAEAIAAGDPPAALTSIHQAVEGGVDAGQLTEQVLGLFRDLMAVHVGCGEELLLQTSTDDLGRLRELTTRLGLESVLAILQVLDRTLVKLRHSTWSRTLLETAAVRCCQLNNLDMIPRLIEQLQAAEPGAGSAATTRVAGSGAPGKSAGLTKPAAKKKEMSDSSGSPTAFDPAAGVEPDPVESRSRGESADWSEARLETSWRNVLAEFSDVTAEAAGNFESLELRGDCLLVTVKSEYDRDICDRPEPRQRLEQALERAAGKPLRLGFQVSQQPDVVEIPAPAMLSPRQRVRQMEQNEFVRAALELFDGEIESVKPAPKRP